MGYECVGVVCKVGSEVERLAPGDGVVVHAISTLETYVKSSLELCLKIPVDLRFEDAATMPVVYCTAVHCLMDLGQLEKGQVGLPVQNNTAVLTMSRLSSSIQVPAVLELLQYNLLNGLAQRLVVWIWGPIF